MNIFFARCAERILRALGPWRTGVLIRRMSALGQKQTFAVQNRMSALPPKAEAEVSSDQGLHTVDPDKGS